MPYSTKSKVRIEALSKVVDGTLLTNNKNFVVLFPWPWTVPVQGRWKIRQIAISILGPHCLIRMLP